MGDSLFSCQLDAPWSLDDTRDHCERLSIAGIKQGNTVRGVNPVECVPIATHGQPGEVQLFQVLALPTKCIRIDHQDAL